MQLVITGYRRLEEVWLWCRDNGIETQQGRVYYHNNDPDVWAWQLICKPNPKLVFLAVKFSDCCDVTVCH